MAAPEERQPTSRPSSFEPLRPATPGWRVFVLICGPLLWVGALILVAFVLKQGEAGGIALAVLGISLLVALVVLVPMRARRVREEESAAEESA